MSEVKRELKSCKTKMETQTKQVQEYSQRLEDYDKKFEESSRKFQNMLTVSVWGDVQFSMVTFKSTDDCDEPSIFSGVEQVQNGAAVLADQGPRRSDRGGGQRLEFRGGGGGLPDMRRRRRRDRARGWLPGEWPAGERRRLRRRERLLRRLSVFFGHAERGIEGARQSGRVPRLGRSLGRAQPGQRRRAGSGTGSLLSSSYNSCVD